MSNPDGGIRYEVYCSGVVAESIRQVHKQGVREGRGEAMVAAFRQVAGQLEKAAKELGSRYTGCRSCACKSAKC